MIQPGGVCHGANGRSVSPTFPNLAAQPAAPGKGGNAALIAQRKQIFLTGQHAPYLYKQLLVIQSVLRTAPVMHGVIKDLNREQMQSVVAYLESI